MKKVNLLFTLAAITAITGGIIVSVPRQNTDAQTETSFIFTAAGDHGGTSPATATLNSIGKLRPAFHLGLGDMSYGHKSPETAWCQYVKDEINKGAGLAVGNTFGNNFPFQMITGNHEDQPVGDDGFIENFASCLPDRMASTGTYPHRYTFDYPKSSPLARIIAVNPNLEQAGQNVQYCFAGETINCNWLRDQIRDAKSKGLWTIVGMHRTCIATGTKGCNAADSTGSGGMGAELMNLLVSEKVDILLNGHDHTYQRSKQLAHSSSCAALVPGSYNAACVVDDGADKAYTKNSGLVQVTSGLFGVGGTINTITTTDKENPYFAAWMGSNAATDGQPFDRRGYSKITITSTELKQEFIDTTANAVKFTDSFTITGGGTTIPPQPPCATLPTDTGSVISTIEVPADGTYKVWSRIKSGGNNANSYWLQIDDQCGKNVGDQDGMPTGSWAWVDYQEGTSATKTTVNLTAGTHTLKRIGRELGTELDRVIITQDTACIPDGVGNNCTSVANMPPSISITSPTDGASFVAPASISIDATATDSDGSVSKVEFFQGTTKLGEDLTSPYSYAWANVAAGTYSITARAIDNIAADNTSLPVNVTVSAPPSDTTPPSIPTLNAPVVRSSNQIDLSWTASTDTGGSGLAGYALYNAATNGIIAQFGPAVTTYSHTGLTGNTDYSYYVKAYDGTSLYSAASNTQSARTPQPPDTTKPSTPTNLTATVVSSSQINLSWTASTDNVGGAGVRGYRIYRGGIEAPGSPYTPAVNSGTISWGESNLIPSTTYAYTVTAFDAATPTANESLPAGPVSATTKASPATLKFNPSDDATIKADFRSTNYGTVSFVKADNNKVENILIKLNVTGVGTRRVTSAKLRLYVVSPSDKGGNFYRTATNTWAESTVNWGNAPAVSGSAIATLGPISDNTWIEINLASVITTDGTYSFRANSTSADGAEYSSKNATSNKPELILTVE